MTKRSAPLKPKYVTKWWQTQGILLSTGETIDTDNPDRKYVYCGISIARIGTEAFDTLDAAIAQVKKKAAARAKSLQKELDRVKAMARGQGIKTP